MAIRTVAGAALALCLLFVVSCGSTGPKEKPGDGSLTGAVGWHQKGPDYEVGLIRAAAGRIGGYYVALDLGGFAASGGEASAREQAAALLQQANRETDVKKAVALLEKAIQADAKAPGPYNNLGLAYLVAGDRKKARELFQKALAMDPGYRPAQENLDVLQE